MSEERTGQRVSAGRGYARGAGVAAVAGPVHAGGGLAGAGVGAAGAGGDGGGGGLRRSGLRRRGGSTRRGDEGPGVVLWGAADPGLADRGAGVPGRGEALLAERPAGGGLLRDNRARAFAVPDRRAAGDPAAVRRPPAVVCGGPDGGAAGADEPADGARPGPANGHGRECAPDGPGSVAGTGQLPRPDRLQRPALPQGAVRLPRRGAGGRGGQPVGPGMAGVGGGGRGKGAQVWRPVPLQGRRVSGSLGRMLAGADARQHSPLRGGISSPPLPTPRPPSRRPRLSRRRCGGSGRLPLPTRPDRRRRSGPRPSSR